MSRFDRTREIAKGATEIDAAATRRRSERKTAAAPSSTGPAPEAATATKDTGETRRFRIRLHITVDETDPLGTLLAEYQDGLSESQREWFDPNKIVRKAVLAALPELAGKLR